MTTIQRIDHTNLNMDRDLALLTLSPRQIGERLGHDFSRDEDDLGAFSYLLFRVGDNHFVLESHDDGPAGTVLRGEDTAMPGGIARRFMQAVNALGLASAEIAWRTPLANWRRPARPRSVRARAVEQRLSAAR